MSRQAYNPLDRRAHEQQRDEGDRAKQLAAEQLKSDLEWLMADARGRRLMWQWLGEAGLFRTSFTGDSRTYFRDGMRNMGLFMQGQLVEHVPEHWALMFLDHNKPAA